MNILAIESSCDETACAILSFDKENPETSQTLLSNVVVSQIDIFKSYGGVIPEVAARSHLEAILPVIDKAFSDANILTKTGENYWSKIDSIAVTHTPGLLGSLLIGTLTARTLAILHKKPLYAIHHLKSHIYSNWLLGNEKSKASRRGERCSSSESFLPATAATYIPDDADRFVRRTVLPDVQRMTSQTESGDSNKSARPQALETSTPQFPLLALVISGGHTQIIYMKSHNTFEIIGTTLDDAVGECFDKVAKILGLPYPGGPSIASAAKLGNSEKYKFPHPHLENPLDFSFSGLKTAVLRSVQKEVGVPISFPSHELKNLLNPEQVADFAASFEKTAADILLEKLRAALALHPEAKSLVFAGGVSANNRLRQRAEELFRSRTRTNPEQKSRLSIFFPLPSFSGDNAAMVAVACLYEILSGVEPTDPYSLNISPRSVIQ